jgi:hypothetical protein
LAVRGHARYFAKEKSSALFGGNQKGSAALVIENYSQLMTIAYGI